MEFWIWMFGAFVTGSICTALLLGLFGMNEDGCHEWDIPEDGSHGLDRTCARCGHTEFFR